MSDFSLADWRKSFRSSEPAPIAASNATRLRALWSHPLRLATIAGTCIVGMAALAFPMSWPPSASARATSPMFAIAAPPQAAAPVMPASPTDWIAIIKPIEIFALDSPDLSKAAKVYSATRNRLGGGRRDSLALGMLANAEPAIALSLYRRGHEAYAPPPLFADLARQAAEAGLSLAHSGLPDIVETRFGAFEVVSVTLDHGSPPPARSANATSLGPILADAAVPTPSLPIQGKSAATVHKGAPLVRPKKIDMARAQLSRAPVATNGTCTGFRLIVAQPALTVTGLACGGQAVTISKQRLGCLLDRIDLASGGDDRSLVDFFAASELKRDSACGGMRLGPDGSHAAWLDDRPATPGKNVRHH